MKLVKTCLLQDNCGGGHLCLDVNAPQYFSQLMPCQNFHLVGEVNVYMFYENEYKGHAFMIFHGK
jgi:hypothetical protein